MNKKRSILSHIILVAISITFFVLWNAERSKDGLTPLDTDSSNQSAETVAGYKRELHNARQQVSELLDEIKHLRNELQSFSGSSHVGARAFL